jgi:hypothetical protein
VETLELLACYEVNLIELGKPSATVSLKQGLHSHSFCRFVIEYFHTTQFAEFSRAWFTQISSLARAESWLFIDSAFCSLFSLLREG